MRTGVDYTAFRACWIQCFQYVGVDMSSLVVAANQHARNQSA
jgi:hypothetical protein